MLNLNDISEWQKALGLLPVKLFSESINNFILLDGGIGDFCLDVAHEEKPEDYYFSSAWSSNTKNFVSVNDEVTVYNWKKDKKERIKISSVAGNYNKFYEYLISNSVNSEIDIVPFVLSIFRKLRNLTDDKQSGTEALNLLFLLLSSYEENISFDNVDKTKWGLSDFELPQADFQKYVDEFSEGILGKLKPKVELILRHSSGALFQEAQKEALFFDKTPDLFLGTFSGSYSTKSLANSSIHYTPSYLARTIVENALNKLNLDEITNLKILDPACGSSEFLMEVLKQLKSRGFEGNVHVTGRDISPSAINTSNFLLSYEKREWGEKLNFNVILVEDSLRENWDTDYDLILMNPPFLSWVEMGKDAREAVIDSLADISEKRPNQASAFVYKSVSSLKEGGVIGSVIPSSILTLDSYKKLRSEIQEIISFSLIGKLGNFVFQDAFTDISIIVGQKPKSNENPLILWTRNEKEIAIEALRNLRKLQSANLPSIGEKKYSIYRPLIFPFNKDSWKLISLQEHELFNRLNRLLLQKKLITVKSIFTVQQGIRTGNNLVFKVSTSDFESLPNGEKTYFRPTVDNDSIKSGLLQKINYVWYPYNTNGLIVQTEEELQELVPDFYNNVLLIYKEALINRSRKDINNWWTLSEPRGWLITKYPKLVSTEFGKSNSFAFDESGEFVVERGYGWIPKKEFKDFNDYYFYLTIFSNPFFDHLLSIYSRQLAGGNWYDLGKKHTSDIPIPKITEELKSSGVYDKLVSTGKRMSSGNFVDLRELENYVKKFIYLFILSPDERFS